jgi:hypothetical protein
MVTAVDVFMQLLIRMSVRDPNCLLLTRNIAPVAVSIPTLSAPPATAETSDSAARAIHKETPTMIHYRTATIDGNKIFYREAGDRNGPSLLLLHGFPTS